MRNTITNRRDGVPVPDPVIALSTLLDRQAHMPTTPEPALTTLTTALWPLVGLLRKTSVTH